LYKVAVTIENKSYLSLNDYLTFSLHEE